MTQPNALLIPQFVIKLDGTALPNEMKMDLARLEVDRAIFLPGMATLEFHDQDLKWADDAKFAIGKTLTITASAADMTATQVPLFEGEITSLEMNFDLSESSTFLVRAYDRSHRLQRTRQAKSFEQQKDSDAISAVAGGGGMRPTVTSTSDVRPQILQDNTSDYEFICRLARRNGMVVLSDGQQLFVKKPSDFTAPAIQKEYRNGLSEFHPVLTATSQVSKVTTRGWDPKTKQAVVGEAKTTASGAETTGWGGTGSKLASSFGTATSLVTDVPFTAQGEGDALAKAGLADRWSRDMRGEGTAYGDPKILPGTWLQLTKLGTRFSGKYFVTRARHVYRAAAYDTEFWISGLEPETAADLVLGSAHQTQNSTGGGVAVGIVTNVNDPDKMGRVKLKFPWLDDNIESWARPASPMGGAGRGFQFMPEINDEVLVGFDHGDRGRPFVLGGLWNGKDAPPMAYDKFFASGKVVRRQIVSSTGHVIEFDDTAGSEKFSIITSKEHKIVIDDKAKSILISNKDSKNSIEIDSSGSGKVTIKSSGDVTVEATGKVTVNAKMDAEVNALNVKVAAKGNLELSGTMVKVAAKATLDLSATGITSIKGGLVKIN